MSETPAAGKQLVGRPSRRATVAPSELVRVRDTWYGVIVVCVCVGVQGVVLFGGCACWSLWGRFCVVDLKSVETVNSSRSRPGLMSIDCFCVSFVFVSVIGRAILSLYAYLPLCVSLFFGAEPRSR